MSTYNNTSCLFSTIRNTSGKTAHFGFFPPHGVTLEANEEITIMGEVSAAVVRGQRVTSRRNLVALESALEDGVLTLINTAAVILKDTSNSGTKQLRVNSGTLGVVDPCWASTTTTDYAP